MADASAFDWVCGQLEEQTSLDRLEARGTVRLALKGAGLDAASVTVDQMTVVIGKVMSKELSARGVDDADQVCGKLVTGLGSAGIAQGGGGDTPDAIFSRLGGGA